MHKPRISWVTQVPVDGLCPPPPEAAFVDSNSGAWILSRYAEVLSAFQEPLLWPVGPSGSEHDDPRDEYGTTLHRKPVLDSLSSSHLNHWRAAIEKQAGELLDRLPTGATVDLYDSFAKPWCRSLAITATGAKPSDFDYLCQLADDAFSGTGAEPDSPRRLNSKAAVAEMKRYYANAPVPMSEQTFMGIAQSLPRLLVNGWLALFRHPDQVERLRNEPQLMPYAVEEVLRYAGIIPRLFRKAKQSVDLGPLQVAEGDRVTLMIASANRDPEKFSEPNRVDVSRRSTGQLALGLGRSSCAGARLIRFTHEIGIGEILRRFRYIELTGPVAWRHEVAFCWPEAVNVTLERSDN